MDFEKIRQSYRPDNIKLLMVGESPPASKGFFYVKSNMTLYTIRTFKTAYGMDFKEISEFLSFFKSSECFLDDLCHTPVNNLSRSDRRQSHIDNIEGLSKRIKQADPEIVVTFLKSIKEHVNDAILMSGCRPEIYVLPFPGQSHQVKYMDGLTDILKRHLVV